MWAYPEGPKMSIHCFSISIPSYNVVYQLLSTEPAHTDPSFLWKPEGPVTALQSGDLQMARISSWSNKSYLESVDYISELDLILEGGINQGLSSIIGAL